MSSLMVLLWLFCSSSLYSYSQSSISGEEWYNGELFLNDNSSVIGKVQYDFSSNRILIKSKGNVAVYNPTQFNKLVFTTLENQTRTFVVRSKKNNKGFHVALFFEELVSTGTKLLVREEIVYYSTGTMASQGFMSEIIPLLVYNYYFQYPNQEIIAFNNNRRKVLKIMKSKTDMIKSFVKSNKLRYSQKTDLVKIFKYFNEISTP